jgi:hypothetical protein
VLWPDGRTETWSGVPIDRYTTLAEGVVTPKRGTREGGTGR